MIFSKRFLPVAVMGMALATPVLAADMDPVVEITEQMMQPVEVGSGWYLRGDVSYNFETDVDGRFGSTNFELGVDSSSTFSAGVGYQFNDFLRADVTYGYERRGFEDTSEKLRVQEVMANGYVDLGTFVGVTPYIGGGLGGANLSMNGDDENVFAWALMTGFSYDLASNIKLDIGYRFLGLQSSIEEDIGGVTAQLDDLYSHQVRAGLRVTTW